MKILLISSIYPAELILSTAIIRALKKQKKASIDLLTAKKYIQVFEANPYLKRIKTAVNNDKLNRDYDLIIDLQNSRQSKRIRNGSSKHYSFKKDNLNTWLYTTLKINRLQAKHLIDQYFELLKPLGIQNDFEGLDYFIPDKDVVESGWLPESHQNGYAVFAIGSASNTQKLPVNRMIELCDRINKPIILLGEESDEKRANEVARFFKKGSDEEEKEIKNLNKKTSIFNACGKFNLNQCASIIENSRWVFTHENIYMQIAAAFKKQVFSIWGSNTPLFGKYPYETKFTVFEHNKLGCRPCSSTGYNNCPKGHFNCMNELTFDFYLPD